MWRRPWLRHRAALTPQRMALTCAGIELRYEALLKCVEECVNSLRVQGIMPGEIVATLLPNGLSFAFVLHALDQCGATLVPLNTRLTPSELAHQLRDSAATLLLHGAGDLADRGVAACREVGSVRPCELHAAGALKEPSRKIFNHRASARSHAGLAILFTSGTTGQPKGALLTHESFEASAMASALHLGVLPGDRWLACMPLFHVGGLSILVRSVLYGTSTVVHERFDEERVNRSLDAEGITLVSLAPTMLERVLDARGERVAPAGLRCVLLGGGPASLELLERARELRFPVAPTYGLTEATSQVATRLLDDDSSPLDAGLAPLPGTELRIAGPCEGDAAAGEAGEVLVRGRTVMARYVNRPHETEDALRGGWLHTGDIGCLDERGRLRVLERRVDLIVSGGENIYPAEIETVLLEHPAVLEACVAAQHDRKFGNRPAAWLVLGSEAPGDEELEAFCRKRLAGYKLPIAFHRVAALPRNAAGKLLRRRLTRD